MNLSVSIITNIYVDRLWPASANYVLYKNSYISFTINHMHFHSHVIILEINKFKKEVGIAITVRNQVAIQLINFQNWLLFVSVHANTIPAEFILAQMKYIL